MKMFWSGAFALGAAGAAVWWLPGVFSAEPEALAAEANAFEATRGELRITVSENGYLKAKNSQMLKPGFHGQATITWLVDEGAEVAEGDVLVEFDATDLEERIGETENLLLQYETELEAARADLAVQERDNRTAIEKAELAVEVGHLSLEQYEKGEYPNQLRKLELALEKAQSEHRRAKERYETVPQLRDEGFMTDIEVEEERIRVREAQINEETAGKELESYVEYTRLMDLKKKQAELRDGERSLETAREKAEINIKEKQARISQKERQVKSTGARLKKEREELENHKLRAPSEGLVHYGDPRRTWERDRIRVGNTVSSGMTLITLPDLRVMEVLINVHEADIDLIEVGHPVFVSLDSYKGRVFNGKVTEIATVATSAGWNDSDNKQFRVVITMDEIEEELRAGITARVEILVDVLEDALHVPIHAVFAEGDEFFCFLADGGEGDGARKQLVSIGKNNAHFVEILDGLSAGDAVLMYDPRDGDGVIDGSGRESSPGEDAADSMTPQLATE